MTAPMSPWVRRLLSKGWRIKHDSGGNYMVSPEGKRFAGTMPVFEAKK